MPAYWNLRFLPSEHVDDLLLTSGQSDEWIYGQTPQFTLSSHPSKEDPRPRPALPAELESSVCVVVTVVVDLCLLMPGADSGQHYLQTRDHHINRCFDLSRPR